MGLDLTYKAGDHDFSVRFSMADWQTIGELKQHLPAAVSACFDVEEFGEAGSVPLATLRESVSQLDAFLVEHPDLLPYTYQFKADYLQIGDKRIVLDRFESGGHSGFQLPGDDNHWYSIRGGLNVLELARIAQMPDGKFQLVDKRDIRGEKELMTSNSGRVQFRKRRAKTSLRKNFSAIRAFLASVSDPQIKKIIG